MIKEIEIMTECTKCLHREVCKYYAEINDTQLKFELEVPVVIDIETKCRRFKQKE